MSRWRGVWAGYGFSMVFVGWRKNGKYPMRGKEAVENSDLGWTVDDQSKSSMRSPHQTSVIRLPSCVNQSGTPATWAAYARLWQADVWKWHSLGRDLGHETSSDSERMASKARSGPSGSSRRRGGFGRTRRQMVLVRRIRCSDRHIRNRAHAVVGHSRSRNALSSA